jgi:hypothetical protein
MAGFTLPRWITWDRENQTAEQIPDSPLRYKFTREFRGAWIWPYDSILLFVSQYQGKYNEAVKTSDGLLHVIQLPNGVLDPRRGALPRGTAAMASTSSAVASSGFSADVQQIQKRLNQLPSSLGRLSEDGRWGARTAARVQEFQRSVGISADGQVGAQTRAALSGGGVAATTDNPNAPPPRLPAPPVDWSKYLLYGSAFLFIIFLTKE